MESANLVPDRRVPLPCASRRDRLFDALRRTGRWFQGARRQRKARMRLHEMDDHTLRDIGLLRDQIDVVFRSPAGPCRR